MSELRDRFEQAVRPLGELVAEMDTEVLRLERELSELRELRRNVKAVVAKLEPPKPKKNEKLAATTQARHAAERVGKRTRVAAYIVDHCDGAIDITAALLLDDPLGPNSNGSPKIGRALMAELLDELRDKSVLRLDRVAQGGQPVYRRVIA